MTKGKGGTSRKQAAHRRNLFVEAYCTNGGNATQAAITAGYSKNGARVRGATLVTESNVADAIKARQAAALETASQQTNLTAAEVLQSLARDIRFDPAKLYNEDGTFKKVHELDEDTRLALRSVEVDEIGMGRGAERVVVGHTTKVKFPEKTAARDQGMKHFGLYKRDNEQQPPAVVIRGTRTAQFQPFKGRA
jgi:phage terminase small subunit